VQGHPEAQKLEGGVEIDKIVAELNDAQNQDDDLQDHQKADDNRLAEELPKDSFCHKKLAASFFLIKMVSKNSLFVNGPADGGARRAAGDGGPAAEEWEKIMQKFLYLWYNSRKAVIIPLNLRPFCSPLTGQPQSWPIIPQKLRFYGIIANKSSFVPENG
jgi:hypothetical protein